MQPKLTSAQKSRLLGIRDGQMQAADDSVRDELVDLGLVEMKLGGWGLTEKGRTRAVFG